MRFLDVFKGAFRRTVDTLRKKPSYIFYSSTIDVLFLVIFGGFLNELILRIQYLVILIFESTQAFADNVQADAVFSGFAEIDGYIKLIFVYLAILMVVAYLCYSMFKGLNWTVDNSE